MRTVYAQKNKKIILGRQGEDKAVRVVWPGIVSDWSSLYGDGSFQLSVRRFGDENAYPVVVEVSGDDIRFTVTSAETAIAGNGKCELTYIANGTIAKSATWETVVINSLTGQAPSEPPEEPAKSWFTAIQGQIGNLANLATASKDSLVAAINEAAKSGGGAVMATAEPAEDDIPKVYWTGALPTSKTEGDIQGTIRYKSKTADFQYPATLKVQGSSSANYAKKNFTLKVYSDSTYVDKVKLAFRDWGKLNKFVLKAHWIDHSHVRNVGTAKIWGKIVEARSDYASLPEELRNAPNNGATDGFSIKFFANGVYQGLYEWIVPKDKLFGQDSNISTHSIMNSELNNQPTCAFATTSPTISGNWSEELQDSMSTAISTSFANLIKFVAGSTDEEFVANAENYFDVQSVIDFDIFARVFCIVDNLCRNQIFFTYDGAKWYEGVWDVDAILGLPPTVRGFFAYDTEFQTGYIAYKDYGVTNLLYQRVENLFLERFKARYAELRSGVLSVDSIIDVYERLTDTITTYDGLLEEDYASTTGGGKFTGIPYTAENNIQQIRNFVAQRTAYMDEVIGNMAGESGGGDETVPCQSISLSAETLVFSNEDDQTLVATVEPTNTTDSVVWSVDDSGIAIVSEGVVTPVANGSCIVTATCGAQSASCAVSVSCFNTTNVLEGVTWESGLINGNTGADINVSGEPQHRTDYFDISDYAGQRVMVHTSVSEVRFATYDSAGANIKAGYTEKDGYILFDIPDSAVSARISTKGDGATVGIYTDMLSSAPKTEGGYFVAEDGSFMQNATYNSQRITVKPGSELYVSKVCGSGVIRDSSKNYISGFGGVTTISLPENAAYVDVNFPASTTEAFAANILSAIGISQVIGTVACTGISLSASTLTFNGEGSQTLTATVTPDGCTDEVVWSTNSSAVATVSGGVVTAVGNGDAVITATCGAYSATCSVNVSGVELDIL